MANQERAVFLKQSGESFATDETSNWTEQGLEAVAKNIADAYSQREKAGIDALTIVPGGGNVARGRELKKAGLSKYPDSIGRLSTIQNLLALAEKLEVLDVPVEVVIAPRMNFLDGNISPHPYNRDYIREAHEKGKVVIIGGGTGENNVTTDNAVVFYAGEYRAVFDGEIVVLKSTDFDGIFQNDPRPATANGMPMPRRYRRISAHEIMADYERLAAVDEGSVAGLIDRDLEMLVYSENGHSLSEVLAHNPATDTGATIGTLIVPEVCEPEFY